MHPWMYSVCAEAYLRVRIKVNITKNAFAFMLYLPRTIMHANYFNIHKYCPAGLR